jgi:cell division protein FtsL
MAASVDLNAKSLYLLNKYFIRPVLSLNTSVTNLDSSITTFTNLSSVLANASAITTLNASVSNLSNYITTFNSSFNLSITDINSSISQIKSMASSLNTSLSNLSNYVTTFNSSFNLSVADINSSITTINTSLRNAIDTVNSTTLSIGGTNGTLSQSYAGALTSGTLNIATAITTGNINIGSANASRQVNIGGILIGANSINNTSIKLEIGSNASTIIIGPLNQTTLLNISTVVNGVRIDSHTTNENLLITQGNNKYKVTTASYPTNVCNTALSNIAFSINAMTGDHCTAVGHNCLTRNSSGKYNIAIGADTLPNITTGSYNTALGGLALTAATTTSSNVAIGYNALASNVASAYPNVAVGQGALQTYNHTGGANVAVGVQALGSLTTGSGNVAIGDLADNSPAGSGVKNTTSSNNVCIGNRATSNGFTNTIVLGFDSHANADNQIIIGSAGGGQTTWIQGSGGFNVNNGPTNLKYTTIDSDQRVTGGIYIASTLSTQGNLVAGTNTRFSNSASSALSVGGNGYGGSSTIWAIFCANGRIHCSELWMSSDERIKKNIKDIEDNIALEHLRNFQPKIFNYIDNISHDTRPIYGFIAQDLENNIPYSVTHSTNNIPNIFEMSDVSNGNIITLRTKDTSLFNANENGKDSSGNAIKINVYDEKDKQHTTTIVRIIDNKSFEIKDKFTDATLFIYGQEINDFKVIQKDAIYTITVAALQQIDREYQVTKQEVIDLKTTVQQQQSQIDALMARVTALENKV